MKGGDTEVNVEGKKEGGRKEKKPLTLQKKRDLGGESPGKNRLRREEGKKRGWIPVCPCPWEKKSGKVQEREAPHPLLRGKKKGGRGGRGKGKILIPMRDPQALGKRGGHNHFWEKRRGETAVS